MPDEPPPSTPTAPRTTDRRRLRRARLLRRTFAVALGLFLALGALNVYGVRTGEASATGGGYELTVTYASVTRPGLATPWSFEIRRSGGFPGGVSVALSSAYFDAFDENGLSPEPLEERDDGERTVMRFGPTSSDVLAVSFDARLEPGVQLSRVKGSVSVLAGADGPPAVTVDFATFVMP